MSTCKTCGEPLEYSGRGRRPVYCKNDAKRANIARTIANRKRRDAHNRGETLSKWGSAWLVDGKPVKRMVTDSYVYSASKGNRSRRDDPLLDDPRRAEDLIVSPTSNVFEPFRAEGAEVGTSTNYKDLRAELEQKVRDAREAGKAWVFETTAGKWWEFEEWANSATTIDVRDTISVHGSGAEAKPFTREELDDWADYFDDLNTEQYHEMTDKIISIKRAQNGLGPEKENTMGKFSLAKQMEEAEQAAKTSRVDKLTSLTVLQQEAVLFGGMGNVYLSDKWTAQQMAHLTRLVRQGLKYSEIARDHADLIGHRSQDALSRKFKRLLSQNRDYYVGNLSLPA